LNGVTLFSVKEWEALVKSWIEDRNNSERSNKHEVVEAEEDEVDVIKAICNTLQKIRSEKGKKKMKKKAREIKVKLCQRVGMTFMLCADCFKIN
jgi:hypothetical protein